MKEDQTSVCLLGISKCCADPVLRLGATITERLRLCDQPPGFLESLGEQ